MTFQMEGLYDPARDFRLVAVQFTPPPGARILFAGADAIFADAVRKTLHLIPLPYDEAVLFRHERVVTLCMPSRGFVFVVRYTYVDWHGNDIVVVPVIATDLDAKPELHELAKFPKGSWTGQGAIDAYEELLLRRIARTEGRA